MCSRLAIFLVSLLIIIGTSAETLETRNGLTIHYSVVPTLMLSKNVANQYQFVRAKDRSILNIAIKDGSGSSVQASVEGKKENLLGQQEELSFSEFSDVCQRIEERLSHHKMDEIVGYATSLGIRL